MVTKGKVGAWRLATAAQTIRWVVHGLKPHPLIVNERHECNGLARGLARGLHQAAEHACTRMDRQAWASGRRTSCYLDMHCHMVTALGVCMYLSMFVFLEIMYRQIFINAMCESMSTSTGALDSPIKLVLGPSVEDFSGMQEYAARFFPRIDLLPGTPQCLRTSLRVFMLPQHAVSLTLLFNLLKSTSPCANRELDG